MSKAEQLSAADKDALAGELAFGVLEGEERELALRLMISDQDFSARVDRWRKDSAGLFDAIEDIEPPAETWPRIAARISPAANDNWHLRVWQGSTLLAGAVAASLAAILLLQPAPAQPGRFAVAQLQGPIEGLRIAARFDPASATLHVRAIGMPATPTEPELWLVADGAAPVSLGQIDRDGETIIPVAAGHRALISPGATFSLSMEPPSSRPSSAPTSDFVAAGVIDLI